MYKAHKRASLLCSPPGHLEGTAAHRHTIVPSVTAGGGHNWTQTIDLVFISCSLHVNQ